MNCNASTVSPSWRRKLNFHPDGEPQYHLPSMNVYLFGWPGALGGACTKFTHLVWLVHRHHAITVVTTRSEQLLETQWTGWMDDNNIAYCAIEAMPEKLRGWGVALCDTEFLGSAEWVEMRRRGLKMAWGNEMMWPLPRETGAVI